ncbi:unnamed protein product, partial [marine sediment metagenome]
MVDVDMFVAPWVGFGYMARFAPRTMNWNTCCDIVVVVKIHTTITTIHDTHGTFIVQFGTTLPW